MDERVRDIAEIPAIDGATGCHSPRSLSDAASRLAHPCWGVWYTDTPAHPVNPVEG